MNYLYLIKCHYLLVTGAPKTQILTSDSQLVIKILVSSPKEDRFHSLVFKIVLKLENLGISVYLNSSN